MKIDDFSLNFPANIENKKYISIITTKKIIIESIRDGLNNLAVKLKLTNAGI